MTNTDKKKWSTPRLRVLVRMEAEEKVLTGCKIAPNSGPLSHEVQCTHDLYDCRYGCYQFVTS